MMVRKMTPVDWIIAGFAALLATAGYLRGFLVGAVSLAGFAGGAFVGTRLGPELLTEGNASPYAPLFGLLGALLGGAVLASGLERLGARARARLGSGGGALLDGLLGAVLSAGVALGIAWIAGAVALQTPGVRSLRDDIQRSVILGRLNAALPPTGSVLNALARFDPSPRILGPGPDVRPPTARVARDRDVRDASASVVRVLGTACGLGVSGSGWVAGPGLVVTNAHVVAGVQDTTVQLRGLGAARRATAVAFVRGSDVAVLRVEGLRAPALTLAASPRPGAAGAILGFPRNGPYVVRAGRVGRTRVVLSREGAGGRPRRRAVTPFRGVVRPGNSGGPLVDARGRVATTVFATATGDGPAAGYGVPNGAVRAALRRAGGAVSTGPCRG